MNILICGDVCSRNQLDLMLKGGYNPFRKVTPLIRDNDFAICNFETTLKINCVPISKCGPNLSSNGSLIKRIKEAGFDIVTLANNHFKDFGEDGIKASLSALKAEGLKTVGAGIDLINAQKPLVLEKNNCRIAIINCCEHEFSIASKDKGGCNPLNPIDQFYQISSIRNSVDYVIVIVHGGHEHYPLPSPRMQDWYRFFIDAGADAVINHHQHCYSGYEIYKNKPIFYGIGNFMFNKNGPSETSAFWEHGYMVKLHLSNGDVNFSLIPYTQCYKEFQVVPIVDNSEFELKIKEYNNIISNRNALEREIQKFYLNQSKGVLSWFVNFSNRITQSMYSRGLYPGKLKNKKMRLIANLINCESHRDKLLAVLQDYTKSK